MAVPVADDVRAAIREVMEAVAGGSIDERAYGQPRWVRVDGLHLTLRFLGATPDEKQSQIAAALEAASAGVAPFRVALSGGGAFPDPRRPRVLWIGINEGAALLAGLARRLDERLAPLGWPPEGRPFAPHLTLARTDGVPGADERARSWQRSRPVSSSAGRPTAWCSTRASSVAARPDTRLSPKRGSRRPPPAPGPEVRPSVTRAVELARRHAEPLGFPGHSRVGATSGANQPELPVR